MLDSMLAMSSGNGGGGIITMDFLISRYRSAEYDEFIYEPVSNTEINVRHKIIPMTSGVSLEGNHLTVTCMGGHSFKVDATHDWYLYEFNANYSEQSGVDFISYGKNGTTGTVGYFYSPAVRYFMATPEPITFNDISS